MVEVDVELSMVNEFEEGLSKMDEVEWTNVNFGSELSKFKSFKVVGFGENSAQFKSFRVVEFGENWSQFTSLRVMGFGPGLSWG